MKFTRKRMLDSFKQLEMDLEGNLDNMKTYYKMNDLELAKTHREMFDGMYEEGFNYVYEYDLNGNIFYL